MSVLVQFDERCSSSEHYRSAVSLRDISLCYQSGDRATTSIENISLEIQPGTFVAIVGPSGCGKSTLLNIMAGILKPTAGEVVHFGKPLQTLAYGTGYVLQTDGLLSWKTVSENIGLPLRLLRFTPAEARDRIDSWLERTGLAPFANHYPGQLSGGMRKRVALAQALIHHPKLVLMDEPLSALDVQTRAMIGNELMSLWARLGNTMILVTHDLEEAISMADKVVVLSARPARVKAIHEIDLPRPRDISEIRLTSGFVSIYSAIWNDLREEVQAAHAQRI